MMMIMVVLEVATVSGEVTAAIAMIMLPVVDRVTAVLIASVTNFGNCIDDTLSDAITQAIFLQWL